MSGFPTVAVTHARTGGPWTGLAALLPFFLALLATLAAAGAVAAGEGGSATVPAETELAVPPLTDRVVDRTGTLSGAEIAGLDQQLAALEQRKGSQVAVLLVPSTEPETIEQYSMRVVEQWQLGRKGVDDGVLLLVARDDRAVRIEVGYGLEGTIPDATARRIIDEVIVPRFRQGDFAGGVTDAVQRIESLIDGEPLPEPEVSLIDGAPFENFMALTLLLLAFFGRLARSLLGALPGALAIGLVASLAYLFVVGGLVGAVVAFVVTAILALMFGAAPVGGVGRGGRGGGGSFGGGGFSGGGGGFGGGGASGRW